MQYITVLSEKAAIFEWQLVMQCFIVASRLSCTNMYRKSYQENKLLLSPEEGQSSWLKHRLVS